MTVTSVAARHVPEATTAQPFISIVMPCLNEEATVAVCVAKAHNWLARSGYQGEILVVDNGSSDRSVELATAAGARVIHERRRGYGQAYLRGFEEARGDYIVMGDSDDTYDFSDLSQLVAPLRRGADMVLGNRFAGGIQAGAMPWAHQHIGSPIINFLIRLFFGARIGDSQSGLRAFSRPALQRLGLKSSGMELASEMIVSASRAGLTIAEVPAAYNVRRGESKLNTVRDGWRHIRYLLLAAPDFLFTLPGLVLVAAGIVTTILSFVAPAGIATGSLTWQPVFAATIFVAIGVDAFMLGVVAKLYGVSRGELPEDGWSRLYRRWIKLESVLGIGAVLFVVGLVIDLALFAVWATGGRIDAGLQLAAAAQSLLIAGAELGFGAFLVVAVTASLPTADDDATEPGQG